eukprot:m.125724 g.125724  ORF g.125724 m.125724 type:complete len:665 (+) comp16658_c1_seq1:1298-3292(+)
MDLNLPLRASDTNNASRGSVNLKVGLAGQAISNHLRPQSAPAPAVQPSPAQTQPPAATPANPQAASADPPSNGPLPEGWEQRTDARGRVYFVDHNTRRTQWHRPTAVSAPVTAGGLPQGWEMRRDGRGRVYYVDHNTRTTTWRAPTQQTLMEQQQFENQRSNLSQMQAAHMLRTLNVGGAPQQGSGSAGDAMPPGWEQRTAPNGRPYFVYHPTRTTQWEDPRTQRGAVPTPAMPQGNLPAGWELRYTDQGRAYFVDHNTRTTTFEDPRGPSTGRADIPQYQRDFKYKLFYLRSQCPVLPHNCKIPVSRATLFQDSFNAVMAVRPDPATGQCLDLKRRLYIMFQGEEGLDYGGVSREWFFLLSHEMLNPMYCLFEYANPNNYSLQINPASFVNPEHLTYFRFVGRVVAMAIYHGKFIDNGFTLAFYKRMLGRPLVLKDVESVDAEYHKSLEWILSNEIDELDLEMTFEVDFETLGERKMHELKPGGAQIAVTDANKKEYVDLVVQWRLTRGVEKQTQEFLRGFGEVLPLHLLQVFDERELELLLIGLADFDAEEWQRNTVYRTYNKKSKPIVWFWEVVASMDNEKRARLLQFVTGSCRLPVGGFSELMGSNGPQLFCIEKAGTSAQLPRSHTCFNRLDLPPYKSKQDLEKKLLLAIEETQGFGLE